MLRGPKTFLINQSGILSNVKHEIVRRLKKHVGLQEVNSVDTCDVIVAFVPIVSRAGTDIEAALQTIPTTQPVILVVLHHTFDENYIAPESSLSVNRDGVFAADFLCHEDAGLLICLANDKALKTISDRMISLAPSMPLLPVNRQQQRNYLIFAALCFLFVAVTVLLVSFLVPIIQGQDDTLTTMIPYTSVSTQLPNTAVSTQLPNTTITT